MANRPPRGAMGSPFSGMSDEMAKTGYFDTVGTDNITFTREQREREEAERKAAEAKKKAEEAKNPSKATPAPAVALKKIDFQEFQCLTSMITEKSGKIEGFNENEIVFVLNGKKYRLTAQ